MEIILVRGRGERNVGRYHVGSGFWYATSRRVELRASHSWRSLRRSSSRERVSSVRDMVADTGFECYS